MKSIRTIALISAVIPLALIAQSGSASSSGSGQSGPGATKAGSGQSDIRSSGLNRTGNTSSASASRVTKDSLKAQFTAKKLIGKDVYDNGGKKIGSVEDIVLQGSNASLSGAFGDRDSISSNNKVGGSMSGAGSTGGSETGSVGSSRSGTASAVGNSSAPTSGSTGPATGSYAGSSGVGSSGMSNGSAGSQAERSVQSSRSSSQEAAVIITTGGFAGMGATMLRVPMSQLSYDSGQERFTLAMSEVELDQLKESGNFAARSGN